MPHFSQYGQIDLKRLLLYSGIYLPLEDILSTGMFSTYCVLTLNVSNLHLLQEDLIIGNAPYVGTVDVVISRSPPCPIIVSVESSGA